MAWVKRRGRQEQGSDGSTRGRGARMEDRAEVEVQAAAPKQAGDSGAEERGAQAVVSHRFGHGEHDRRGMLGSSFERFESSDGCFLRGGAAPG